MCISLTGHCTWTKRLRIFMSVMYSIATNRYGEIEPKQEAALEELGFELPNPERKDQRQITVRLFLILPAGQCSWISANVMDWKLTKNRPMEEGSIWRNRTISE